MSSYVKEKRIVDEAVAVEEGVMHIQDKNNYMSCIFRTKTTICHPYSGRAQGQQHLKTMLK
jgi:hypothetical protein